LRGRTLPAALASPCRPAAAPAVKECLNTTKYDSRRLPPARTVPKALPADPSRTTSPPAWTSSDPAEAPDVPWIKLAFSAPPPAAASSSAATPIVALPIGLLLPGPNCHPRSTPCRSAPPPGRLRAASSRAMMPANLGVGGRKCRSRTRQRGRQVAAGSALAGASGCDGLGRRALVSPALNSPQGRPYAPHTARRGRRRRPPRLLLAGTSPGRRPAAPGPGPAAHPARGRRADALGPRPQGQRRPHGRPAQAVRRRRRRRGRLPRVLAERLLRGFHP